ncbi:MAG: hypothetical protein M3P38_05090 [Chloroflexota bacterium]|nr:hypothetical protein [Chloroflexota bacterium]
MRAGVALLVLLAVSCRGSTPTVPSPTPEISPSLDQILSAAKAIEYEVTFKLTGTGQGQALTGQQSWYSKQGKARFDLRSTVAGLSSSMSLFALPDGTFICLGTGELAECTSISGLETARQQNPAAFYLASLTAHPELFSGTPVGTRHVAEQHVHCYDVRPVAGSSGLTDARFCFTTQGIPLVLKVGAQAGQWSMEATRLSTTAPDSDFTLPATPTAVGQP